MIQVETIVNDEIIKNSEVIPSTKSFDDAKMEGAEALFGEKYGDDVRVITIVKFLKNCAAEHMSIVLVILDYLRLLRNLPLPLELEEL